MRPKPLFMILVELVWDARFAGILAMGREDVDAGEDVTLNGIMANQQHYVLQNRLMTSRHSTISDCFNYLHTNGEPLG